MPDSRANYWNGVINQRRDGRVDECDGLENRYAPRRIVGSNPTPSANIFRRPYLYTRFPQST